LELELNWNSPETLISPTLAVACFGADRHHARAEREAHVKVEKAEPPKELSDAVARLSITRR